MAGQARAAPHDLNADQTISASGVAAIRDGEGLRNGGAHYNDIANNCTVGLGTLVHHGPCTAAELAQPADQQANDASLARRIADAEATVRRRVGDRQLTQAQYDALVSATYNLGSRHVRPVLDQANQGNDPGVVQALRARVMFQPVDARGRPVGPMVRSQGLANRREREAAPFAAPLGQR
jgi:lysozyme